VSFRVQRGATGFRDATADPLPEVDLKSFRTAWHAAARMADGQAGSFIERCYPQSFHTATITDHAGQHLLLCHAHYPLIAFVADRQYVYTVTFQEPPAWASAFTDVGFNVLSAELLLSPLNEADTSELSLAGQRQIRHWRPTSVGAALFNCWD
jgi:hypothetical protein